MALNSNLIHIICMILVYCLLPWTRAEVFTAISDCESLLHTHRVVINDLNDYIQNEEKKLQFLKKQVDTFKKEHEKAMEDVSNYLGNPINAFTLIKRLTKDLEEIDQRVKMGQENIRNLTMDRDDVKFPTGEDLIGAANALNRLKHTYKLEVNELAEGLLKGVSYSSSMSAGDCFELGRVLYNERDMKNAAAWMTEALRKYQEENNDDYLFNEIDILDYGSWSYYLLGDLHIAREWILKLLNLDPKHTRARANLHLFEQKLEQLKNQPQTEQKNQTITSKIYNDIYEGLCRGDFELSPEITKKLSCFYLTENHPFLRLAPIKAEKVYADPDAYVFYDVITDNEIAHIKSVAQPRFRRAEVHDAKKGGATPANYRISKVSWISDRESPIVARISRRIADFTGLDINVQYSEHLQISNYGIGGFYLPHFDFARKSEPSFMQNLGGNRIATVLFYMSDVAQGGATVFPELGVSVFPVKNSALFWLNLHPSGEGDLSTKHAACPVLRGSKWVANKWIKLKGQELIKKCTLEYQPEETVRKFPAPILKSDL